MMRFVIGTLALLLVEMVWGNKISSDFVEIAGLVEEKDILKDSIPRSFLDKLDYYYTAWFVSKQDSIDYVDSACIAESVRKVVMCSDSVYLARLDSLQSAIPLSFNDIVRNYIELYTVKKRFQVANMLGLSEYYFPIFEEALDAECMPLELKYLPVIESALNPRAFSRAGACGLWQFMYSTGKMYKLEINSFVDERRDPVLATKAAVRYLNDLYGIYEDWILVLIIVVRGMSIKRFAARGERKITGIFIITCPRRPVDMCRLLLQRIMFLVITRNMGYIP